MVSRVLRNGLMPYINGDVPLIRVFIRDMLIVGTIANMLIGGIGLIAYAEGMPGWLVLAVFLVPLPFNAALLFFVWRAAAKSRSRLADGARAGSVLWFLAVCLI